MTAAQGAPPLRIDGLLLDLDGVCWIGEAPVERASAAIEKLKAAGLPLRFVTNTTRRSRHALATKARRLGLPIEEEEILTAPQAALAWLRNRGLPRCRLLVDPCLLEELSELPRDEDHPEFILLGDREEGWSEELLQSIFEQLMEGAELVALHKGRYWQTADRLRLDLGVYVAGLEYATGKSAHVMGKPSCEFFAQAAAALELTGTSLQRIAMVGDDVLSDVGGAQECGLRGVLVRTGKYRADAVARSGVTPDFVVDSIADVPGLLGID
jgi:HAD superfamily hydrolase (TIGR01458 family)